MIRISPVTLANTKSDAALGGAPGSKLPAQIKTNNQHTKLDKAMPVRGTTKITVHSPCGRPVHRERRAVPNLIWPLRVPRRAKRKPPQPAALAKKACSPHLRSEPMPRR